MVSTVIIEYNLFMVLLPKPSAIYSPYSPEVQSLQQKYHSLPETTIPGALSGINNKIPTTVPYLG